MITEFDDSELVEGVDFLWVEIDGKKTKALKCDGKIKTALSEFFKFCEAQFKID